MTSIIPPWPPTDVTEALPYDQRGCCWPWGTFGPHEKLPMRYLSIGVRTAGAVGAAWGRWKTGQLLVCKIPYTNLRKGFYEGGQSIPVAFVDTLHIDHYSFDGHWFCNLTSSVDVFGNVGLNASGLFSPATPFGPIDLTVSLATGAADPPDYIRLTPLHWYETSMYPWLGTF